MAKTEVTSARVAAIAARGARRPGTLTTKEIAAVCGSALTQRDTQGRSITTALRLLREAVKWFDATGIDSPYPQFWATKARKFLARKKRKA